MVSGNLTRNKVCYYYMRIFDNLKGFINSATETHCKVYNSIVLACCFVFSLGLALIIRPKFEYNIHTDIVSWITVTNIQKSRNLLLYYFAYICAFCIFYLMDDMDFVFEICILHYKNFISSCLKKV